MLKLIWLRCVQHLILSTSQQFQKCCLVSKAAAMHNPCPTDMTKTYALLVHPMIIQKKSSSRMGTWKQLF